MGVAESGFQYPPLMKKVWFGVKMGCEVGSEKQEKGDPTNL